MSLIGHFIFNITAKSSLLLIISYLSFCYQKYNIILVIINRLVQVQCVVLLILVNDLNLFLLSGCICILFWREKCKWMSLHFVTRYEKLNCLDDMCEFTMFAISIAVPSCFCWANDWLTFTHSPVDLRTAVSSIICHNYARNCSNWPEIRDAVEKGCWLNFDGFDHNSARFLAIFYRI